jgi:hypothetical protein
LSLLAPAGLVNLFKHDSNFVPPGTTFYYFGQLGLS